MVSLDNAVLARLEKGGKRYEALVDPDLVEQWKDDSSNIQLDDFMAMDEIFHDASAGERPTEDALMKARSKPLDVETILNTILEKGSIQLTTAQRKARVENIRQQIIHHIHSQAIDPKASLHIHERESNLHFKNQNTQSILSNDLKNKSKMQLQNSNHLIPLSFESLRLAFRIPGSAYGSVSQLIANLSEERRLA